MPSTTDKKRKRGDDSSDRKKRKYASTNKWAIKKAPVPPTLGTKLKYTDFFSLSSTVGVPASYVFSANGLFDPNITGTGHQPRGFDQFMSLYDVATVVGCKVQLWGAPSNDMLACTTSISAKDKTTVATDHHDHPETGYVQTHIHSGQKRSPPLYMEYYINPTKWLGKGKNPIANDVLSSTSSSNPLEQVFLHIVNQPIDITTTSAAPFLYQITLEYAVVFSEPILPPIS